MTQAHALAILKSGANVFLTGEPGAGKSFTVNTFVAWLRKQNIEVAITASTGIAATHVSGMTIHSWSGIGIRNFLTKQDLNKISSTEYLAKRIQKAKVLIIDEISMLAPKTLDMVDAVCRAVKQNDDAFGGIQVVFVGDFFQLPPIQRRDQNAFSQQLFAEEEEALFSYGAASWRRADPTVCYLTEQHRQDDNAFRILLGALRGNKFGQAELQILEGRRTQAHIAPGNVPKLFSHNIDVDRVNEAMLAKIPGTKCEFEMVANGKDTVVASLIKGCLSPERLALKPGASVMFTKNNPKEFYANGTLGTVIGFDGETKFPIVQTRSGAKITVTPQTWTVEEGGKVRGQISQVPLRLAWAITVHKSQGMSLDEAVMDLRDVFEYGQGYVALSRVRRLSGLHLLGWNEKSLQVHPDILAKDEDFKSASLNAESYKITEPVESVPEPKTKAYARWTPEDDAELRKYRAQGLPVDRLATIFSRKIGAIRSRLGKLGIDS